MPVLSPLPKEPVDDLSGPYEKWKTAADPDSTAEILRALKPSIDQGIRLFVGQTNPSPNLQSRARQTALQALGTYQPEKGSLRTHITNAMQGMRRVNRNEQNPVTVPDRAWLDHARLEHASAELEFRLGRPPTDAELADRSGLSMRRIGRIRTVVLPAIPTSRFERPDDEDAAGFQPAVTGAADHSVLHAAVYDELDPVGQKIFEWSLGYNGNRTLPNSVIARKLGISPSAVTQRKERIQRRMDELSRYNL